VATFVTWYNTQHRHSSLQFVTPEQRHKGEDKQLLHQRVKLYENAKKQNPKRWSGHVRNWRWKSTVWLNPTNEIQADIEQCLDAA